MRPCEELFVDVLDYIATGKDVMFLGLKDVQRCHEMLIWKPENMIAPAHLDFPAIQWCQSRLFVVHKLQIRVVQGMTMMSGAT